MSLRLYDTATRAVRDFVSREPGKVGMYVCGLTVQGAPHIGHMRSYVSFDVLRRWLAYRGHEVTHVRNVTDIDDKVLAKSVQTGQPWWAIGYANERLLEQASATLGCLDPTCEPRATGHVPQMLALIDRLIERGHAYAAGPGDVYFDVASYRDYGALSNRRLEDMQPAEDNLGVDGKRDPRDFALWKAVKPDEPADAYWQTPWGRGRPGWHLECSAMAHRYLGEEFDIHGGGLDLVFPHHENEIAQSKAAGYGFARYWMHNGMLNLAGGKMSKSDGNVIDLPTLLASFRPVEIRAFLATPHYRSTVEFSEELLGEAASAYRRIEGFVQRAIERFGATDTAPTQGALCADFLAAMDDDLNTSKAMASIHEVVREGNSALSEDDDAAARSTAASVRAMLGVLGLDPVDHAAEGGPGDDLRVAVDALVRMVLEQRDAARARKDWATADALRDQLKRSGVLIEDTPHGPRWTLADGSA
ncbi:MAG: cysteine--tRNA ligase [Micromonosporaceae bacterium]|nr:cysteine--tRNA ligase [Micromonosporaceae bacterium]